MKLKIKPTRLHSFLLLLILLFYFFESCKDKEQILQGKLEQIASNGSGLVSFKLNGTKTELREFPKAFFDAKKVNYSQPFQFKYRKQNKKEFVSPLDFVGEFPIYFGTAFLPHADPEYTHKKYHTFRNINDLFVIPDSLNIWQVTTDKPGGTILDTLVFNDFLHSIIYVLSGIDTIYIHVNESPVSLQKNPAELNSPLLYKVVSNISYDSSHPHQEVGNDGN